MAGVDHAGTGVTGADSARRRAWFRSAAVWLQACRYRSLAISSIAVVAGTAAAWYHGFFSWQVGLAWLGAVAAQAGTNLTNVAWNYKAARNPDPRGSSAVLSRRMLEPASVRRAGLLSFALAIVAGAMLTWLAGWKILLLGIPGIIAGYFYAAPPLRLGYLALGVATVFVFFGPVMVGGTYFVAAGTVAPLAFWMALPVGLTAAGIMHVNDIRDYEGDLVHGKRTLATMLARDGATRALVSINAAAYLIVVAAVVAGRAPWTVLAVLASLPGAIRQVRLVARARDFASLNQAWFRSVQLHTQFGLLLIAGLVLGRLLSV